jgi:hypothetical protein
MTGPVIGGSLTPAAIVGLVAGWVMRVAELGGKG